MRSPKASRYARFARIHFLLSRTRPSNSSSSSMPLAVGSSGRGGSTLLQASRAGQMQLRAFFFVHWFLPVQGNFDQQRSKIEYEFEDEFEDDR